MTRKLWQWLQKSSHCRVSSNLIPNSAPSLAREIRATTRRPQRKRTRRTQITKGNRRKMRRGRRNHPRRGRARKGRKLENLSLIGASTIWHGPSTSPPIASLGNSTRKNRRSLSRPTLPPLPLRPPQPSIPMLLPSRPPWPTWIRTNDSSRRHTCWETTTIGSAEQTASRSV